ncbi:hypothetical protein EB796_011010 [Bugula neritina]|uniref:SLC18B1 n=1 Tax=Bugula neritina TaxID=10212 RepID=A0A7J7JYE4_BUGNE|nr:hypothetical protein EB796_011010 [Bugula neritina]
MSSLLSNVYMVVSLVVAMSTGVLWASVQPVLEPELRSKFGLSQEISALIFLLIPLSYTITTPLVGKALNKYVSCFVHIQLLVKSLDLIYVMMVAYGICLIDFIFMGPTPLFSNLPRKTDLVIKAGENTRNAVPMTIVDECKPLLNN